MLELLAALVIFAFAIGGVGLIIFLSSCFNGYVLHVLWGWFIVTTFHAPSIGIAQAVGVAMVIGFLFPRMHDMTLVEKAVVKKEDLKKAAIERFFSVLLTPFLILFFGWVLHTYFM